MELVKLVETHVFTLLNEELPPTYLYHNYSHTLGVVQAVARIAKYEQISNEDTEKLLVAAWFHDTGYIKGSSNHEEDSVALATAFLKDQKCSDDFITAVSSLILATAFEAQPKCILEQIIRDADYAHFASENYITICETLREEWSATNNKIFTDLEWAKENLDLLRNKHQYYTSYAFTFWQPIKEKNINRIEKKINKLESIEASGPEYLKKEKLDRGIDTMFRVTLNNHTRLSEIADSKANILLSVNAIIISIALSTLIPKLDSPSNVHLVTPTLVMVFFSVLSIIFAILSTRPKVTSGTFTTSDVEEQKVNLLFFGNFYKMPYDAYEKAMNVMMKDRDYLYNSMIKDLYFLGLVLERKYRLLRITYTIFMIGILVSVFTFVWAFLRLN